MPLRSRAGWRLRNGTRDLMHLTVVERVGRTLSRAPARCRAPTRHPRSQCLASRHNELSALFNSLLEVQVCGSLRLIHDFHDAISFELALRERPVDGAPHRKAEQRGADRRENAYPPVDGGIVNSAAKGARAPVGVVGSLARCSSPNVYQVRHRPRRGGERSRTARAQRIWTPFRPQTHDLRHMQSIILHLIRRSDNSRR